MPYEIVKHSKREYTFSEAAKVLGIRPEAIGAFVKHGVLRTVAGAARRIAADDIDALLAHREAEPATADSASLLARTALANVASLRREFEAVRTLLGLNTAGIECTSESMRALLLSAEDQVRVSKRARPSAVTIMRWARILYAVQEEHLRLLVELGEPAPWEHFSRVAEALVSDTSDNSFEAETARRYLLASRAYFRNVVTMYTRRGSGAHGHLNRPWLDAVYAVC